jgi:hypothetical protein
MARLDSKRTRLRAKRRAAEVLGVKEMAERLGGGRNQVQQALQPAKFPERSSSAAAGSFPARPLSNGSPPRRSSREPRRKLLLGL